MGADNAKFPVVQLGSEEDEIFQGYRRVQIISQTMVDLPGALFTFFILFLELQLHASRERKY